ncbi:uncharacterized protein LOC129571911, partial [Sitodiplosis mosellana]|uniref:uncharacterized protein LOC129571911 n=1 Tax=Sitodiplosis mosellana TaxID=263140 RepID=UPI0024453834
MPKFSGKHTDWPSFNDSFTRLVHQNLALDTIQKLNYLKQALPPNHDRDIHEMPLTEASNRAAWDLLVKRYNSPRILYMHHLNTLYALPVLQKERAVDIKSVLNAANVCITAFRRLNIPIDDCDHWIAHLIATKLPTETHHDWEHHWGSHSEIPTFSDLEKFLNDRLFTLDVIESRGTVHSVSMMKPVHDSHKVSNTHANDSKQVKRNKNFERKSFHTTTARNSNTNGNSNPTENCPVCNGTHVVRRCPTFIAKDCFERKALADRLKLCLNCLSRQHLIAQCGSAKNCLQCGLRHHTMLHFPVTSSNSAASSTNNAASFTNTAVPGRPAPNQASNSFSNPEMRTLATNVFSTIHAPKSVLLATALIPVENVKTGKVTVLRALIDDCSEGTIISEHAANVLGLRRTSAITEVNGVSQNHAGTSNEIVQFALRSNVHRDYRVFVDLAIVMKVVTSDLPSRRVTPQDWPHIHGLVLADPTYFEPGKIDLLIGSEWSASIMLPDTRIGQPNHPIARNTYFGWILHGQTASISKPNSANNQKVTIRTHHTSIDLSALFHDFIEAEKISQEKSHTEEEKWFMDFFKQTHHRQPNGKYM